MDGSSLRCLCGRRFLSARATFHEINPMLQVLNFCVYILYPQFNLPRTIRMLCRAIFLADRRSAGNLRAATAKRLH
jgi:hypothetical protein